MSLRRDKAFAANWLTVRIANARHTNELEPRRGSTEPAWPQRQSGLAKPWQLRQPKNRFAGLRIRARAADRGPVRGARRT